MSRARSQRAVPASKRRRTRRPRPRLERSSAAPTGTARHAGSQSGGARRVETRVHPPPWPLEEQPGGDAQGDTTVRRRLLARASAYLEAFASSSRYESEVKGTALAMIRYMAEHWCGPEHAEHFERWWTFVNRYAVALADGKLAGPGACTRKTRLLGKNQMPPSDLDELWLTSWTNGRPRRLKTRADLLGET